MSENVSPVNPIQHSMKQGLYLGLYMSVNVALLLFPQLGAISGILMLVMFLMYPAVVYLFVKKYRDEYWVDGFSYAQAIRYTILLIFFATIVFAGGQYLVYTILFKQVWFQDSLLQIYDIIKSANLDSEQESVMIDALRNMSPVKLMLSICNWSFLFGLIFSLIIGIFLKKQNRGI